MERIVCILVGYCFGCLLTGELVAWLRTGGSAAELGTGNPGMANLSHELGLRWGLLVLLGDVAKTALACLSCGFLFRDVQVELLWTVVGVALGHNYPFWRRFRGGKGVAVTCAGLILYAPLWGTVSCAAGLGFTLITGWLPLGAVSIPALFLLFSLLFCSWESSLAALLLTGLMVCRHRRGLGRILGGEEPRKFRPAKPGS